MFNKGCICWQKRNFTNK